MRLRIGTRGSKLALAQTNDVARRLGALGHDTEIAIISTAGDRATDRAFSDVGSFGIFVRELEAALIDGRIDVAVHSYKDLPSQPTPGLVVGAVPERVDPADVLLARPGACKAGRGDLSLGEGARVGTSAMRRQALLRELQPDLEIGLLRGNVPTRLRSLAAREFDAIVLAAAGLLRLERSAANGERVLPADVVRMRLDPTVFVPAPSQGAIAVQVRAGDTAVRSAVAEIDDSRLSRSLEAERLALALAEAGCTRPFGAWCDVATNDGALTLHTVLGTDAGLVRATATGNDPETIAKVAWQELTSLAQA